MSQNRDNFAEDLKEVWEPAYAEFLNNSDRTRAQFDKTSRGVVQGKYVKAASHIGRNAGFAFVAEGGQTPAAGHQSFMNELITLKKAVGRIKLSSEVIQDSSSDTAAVADAMSVEKEGLGRDARRELNFLLHSAGNGVIAQCAVSSATNTIALTNPTDNVSRYLRDVISAGGSDSGLRVDIGTVANPTLKAGNRTVQSINSAGTSIVIDGAAITTATTDFIFRAGQGGADGGVGQKVVSSLQQIISDTAPLYGADPAAYPLWKSSVLDAASSTADEDIFTEAFDLLDIETGDTYGDAGALVVTTHLVRRQLAASMQGRVRYQPLELKGGFKSNMTIEAGGNPVGLLVDRDCLDRTAYLVEPSSIVRVVGEEWNFVEEAGSPIQYNMDDDSYHMLMRSRMEYLCKNRRRNGKIINLGAA